MSQQRIAELVGELGDASYARRTEATRALCAIGAPAAAALERVARGQHVEVSLRAQAVLRVIGELMFGGVEIRLAVSHTRINWNDPIDVTLTLTNRFAYPARVPFDIDPVVRRKTTGDARQVGDMLDLAEYLRVLDARGVLVPLSVDEISGDVQIATVVEERVDTGPTETLAPGESVSITIRAFNRGWARYRMLDSGSYSIVLDYVPAWDDESLAVERAGRVVSNTMAVTVVKGAPQVISRHGATAGIDMDRDKDSWVARITNRSDQAVLINGNFGTSPPFAQARWVYVLASDRYEIPVEPRAGASWHDFDAAKLTALAAGESLVLARVGVDELRNALVGVGATFEGDRWTLHFEYDNMCDRRWQKRQGTALMGNDDAPKVFRSLLPRNILTNRQVSDRLAAPRSN